MLAENIRYLQVFERRPQTHGPADGGGDDGERPVVRLRRPDGAAGGGGGPVQAAATEAEGGRLRRAEDGLGEGTIPK